MTSEYITEERWAVISIIGTIIILAMFLGDYGSGSTTFENPFFTILIVAAIVNALYGTFTLYQS